MNSDQKCAKCGASMEVGFLFDRSYDEYGKPSSWVEGTPQKSFWCGTNVHKKVRYDVQTYRCTSCGYLESFATQEWKR